MTLIEGAVVGHYRILSKLGEGGTGTVYRAVDTMIQREVAIKALRPDIASQPDVLGRFRSEAVLLAGLNHPAIAELYAFFSEGGQFYMVMEYVGGATFERVIQQRGAMDWQLAFSYLVQILDGIAHAHAAGIMHRDLKPANVMLTPAGRIKLMDFGIAQALGGARLTRQGRIIGTLEYLAPERIQGKPPDARSDLYSVGVMLYEMLTGRLPFQSDSEYELLQKQIQMAPPDLSGLGVKVPPEVEAVMRTAMEKDPGRRYADAEDFSAALTALLPVRPTASKVIPMSLAPALAPAPAKPASRLQVMLTKPLFWLAVAGILIALAFGIVFVTLLSRAAVKPATSPVAQLPVRAPARTSVAIPPPPEPTPAPVAMPAPVTPPAPPPVTVRKPAPAITRLSDARSIFIIGSDGELTGYLRNEMRKQLGGVLRLASSAADADIVMSITLEAQNGKASSPGRIFGVEDPAQVRAVITDAQSTRVIWEQNAADKKPIVGALRGESVKRLAERIVKELRDSYR